jgi:hypothetical protein
MRKPASASSTTTKNQRLTVFSGHDTVIAPVLSSLGVYFGDLCKWPSYASRIIVEVWTKSSSDISATSAKGKVKVSTVIAAAKDFLHRIDERDQHSISFRGNTYNAITPSISKKDEQDARSLLSQMKFVRVIYNGKDITRRIPSCVDERVKLAKYFLSTSVASAATLDTSFVDEWVLGMFSNNFSLCTMSSFEHQVRSQIAPYNNIDDACANM